MKNDLPVSCCYYQLFIKTKMQGIEDIENREVREVSQNY